MRRALASALLLACSHAAAAEQVICHYTYGGKTRILTAQPQASPYKAKGIEIGSYFLFRLAFQNAPADQAAIKIYTYVNRDEGPALIHQASFPYPQHKATASPYGFSGLQFVYEPVRDSELQYWCEMATISGSKQ
jgi:hypothetical protein